MIPTVLFILALAEPEVDEDIIVIVEGTMEFTTDQEVAIDDAFGGSELVDADPTYDEYEASSGPLEGEPIIRCYCDERWYVGLRAAPMLTPWRRSGSALYATAGEAALGFQVRRIGLAVHGRAWVGPRRTNGGGGGLRGSVNVIHRVRFGLAAEVALTVGGGRDEGGPARLILAVEPGVRALVRTRGGSFGAAVTWHQPFAVDRRWVGALVPSAIWRVLEF